MVPVPPTVPPVLPDHHKLGRPVPITSHYIRILLVKLIAADKADGKLTAHQTGPISANDLAVNVPRYENGYLYPPDGPGLGVELNEAVVPQLMTKGKSPTIIGQR